MSRLSRYCWGYPFDWGDAHWHDPKGTLLIMITLQIYEAFLQSYRAGEQGWRLALRSIAAQAPNDIRSVRVTQSTAMSTYTPSDWGGVINASAYRARLNADDAAVDLGVPRRRNLWRSRTWYFVWIPQRGQMGRGLYRSTRGNATSSLTISTLASF